MDNAKKEEKRVISTEELIENKQQQLRVSKYLLDLHLQISMN